MPQNIFKLTISKVKVIFYHSENAVYTDIYEHYLQMR